MIALCARSRRASRRARSRSAAATARCSASCTGAASAGGCRASRSPRRPSRSRAARPEIESVERYDGVHLAARRTALTSSASSRTCSSTCPTRRRCWRRSRAPAARWSSRCRSRRTCRRGGPASARTRPRSATCSGSTARAVREIVARAGLSIAAELEDPLPLDGPALLRARLRARGRQRRQVGRARQLCTALAPPLARRLFTLHYACLCLRPGRVAAENSSDSTLPISSSGTASGSASFWRAMPSASASIAIASCSAGRASSRSNSRTPSAISSREHCAHLREARGDLRPHLRVAHAVGPELHEQQQQLGLALDHRHPLARAAGGALGDRRARSRTASAISRACSSISRSISTRKRSSLPSKFEYSAPVEKPGLGGDLLDRGAVEAAAREHAARGREQALAGVRAALLARHARRASCAAVSHRPCHHLIYLTERPLFR